MRFLYYVTNWGEEYNSNPMPILDAHMLEFFSRSPEQTRRIGVRLGGALQTGDVICLQGDLGAESIDFLDIVFRLEDGRVREGAP